MSSNSNLVSLLSGGLLLSHNRQIIGQGNLNNQANNHQHKSSSGSKTRVRNGTMMTCRKLVLMVLVAQLVLAQFLIVSQVESTVLMRVCDTREVKTVTSRVCMLYKRTKNSDVKLDKHGNLRISKRQAKSDYSPAKLASDCCKIGCPAHIFATIC